MSEFRSILFFVTNGGFFKRTIGDVVRTDGDGEIVVSSILLSQSKFGDPEYQVWVKNERNESAIWKTIPWSQAEAERDFVSLLKKELYENH